MFESWLILIIFHAEQLQYRLINDVHNAETSNSSKLLPRKELHEEFNYTDGNSWILNTIFVELYFSAATMNLVSCAELYDLFWSSIFITVLSIHTRHFHQDFKFPAQGKKKYYNSDLIQKYEHMYITPLLDSTKQVQNITKRKHAVPLF